MDLSGTISLVTGGGHRVGKGIVMALAAAGSDVFIHYGRSDTQAAETAEQAGALGVRTAIGPADLSDPRAAPQLVADVIGSLGPPTVLINSASSFPEDTLASVKLEDFERTMRLSLYTPVFLAQALVANLPNGAEGAVVNVTDWRAERPYPEHFSYTLAKGALMDFTRVAAIQLAPRVRVNAVALGAILPPPGKDSAYLKELAGTLPLRRIGSPELVGQTVVHLVQNDFMTGEIVRLDGGAHLA
ncbi:MAG: SDR family oxidoreductase [Acidimicrobiia bacterium]|nr:SDR family oxidoreductase [Acidimicrobiia bacterium]